MNSFRGIRSKSRSTAIVALAWSVVALVVGVQNYLAARLDGSPISIIEAILRHLPILTVWAIATPLIFRMARRFPFIGKRWRTHLPMHVALGVSFVVAINAASPILYPSTFADFSIDLWLSTTAANITTWLPLALLVFFVIGALGQLTGGSTVAHGAESPDSPDTPGDDSLIGYADHLTIRGLNRSFVVPTTEIEWIEASGDHVIFHVGERSLKERRPLKEVEQLLDPHLFVRVHRSVIAQVTRIREIHALEHGDFLLALEDGARVRLSRSRRRALEQALGRSI